MSTPPVPMTVRAMREEDRAFVLDSWVRSYIGKTDGDGYDDRGELRRDYTPVVRDLLSRCTVLVACLEDEPSAIVGWLAVEGDVLHYALVKPRWRKLGIARWLLADYAPLRVVYTHRTSDADKCPVPPTWEYRRWKIWKEHES